MSHLNYFNELSQSVAFAPFKISRFHADLLTQANSLIENCKCNQCKEISQNYIEIASLLPFETNQFELAEFYQVALFYYKFECLHQTKDYKLFLKALKLRIEFSQQDIIKNLIKNEYEQI